MAGGRSAWSMALAVLLTLGVVLGVASPGCRSATATAPIEIRGALDMVRLAEIVVDDQAERGLPRAHFQHSTTSIEDLKQGRCNVVFLGRDALPEEMRGLREHVVAYDAACLLIDENSFEGGIRPTEGRPSQKAGGLKELSLEELRNILRDSVTGTTQRWLWVGPIYRWDPVAELTGEPSLTPMPQPTARTYTAEEIAASENWALTPRVLNIPVYPPGMYDTQSVVFKALGLDEGALPSSRAGSDESKQASYEKGEEEVVLSVRYRPGPPNSIGGSSFEFRISICSFRVAKIAPKHIPVRVLAVEGVDPVVHPATLYSGSYPLTRKIYVLTREGAPPEVEALAHHLTSAEGQRLVEKAGHLPAIDRP